MITNNYLTCEEQKIMQYLSDKEILDTELVSIIFPDMAKTKINKILHQLYKKKYIKRAKRNIYYTDKLLDYNKLALRINNGYIGLFSALKYYGLLDYEDFTIFVMTKTKRQEINLENYTIKYTPLNEKYSNYKEENGLKISTLEKTFYDCFLKLNYTEYAILTKAIYETKTINWKLMTELLKESKPALRQKAGYILTMLQTETNYKIPSFVFEDLHQGIQHPIKLGPDNNRKFDKHWKVQSSITKEQILSWWR